MFSGPVYGPLFLSSAISPAVRRQILNKIIWQLTPPEIIGTTKEGHSNKKSANLKSSDQDGLQFNLESYLKFSKADRGLKLSFETKCEELFYQGTLTTAEVVSLARLVPPQVLSDLYPGSSCQISIKVENQVGSIHHFQLKNVTLLPNALEANSSNHERSSQTKLEPLRLVCGKWWSEEDRETLNGALPFETRVRSLASASVVMGSDDRNLRMRPLCRVFQLHGESGMSLIKSWPFALPGLETTITKSIVLPPGSHYTFLSKPLIAWTLQNASQRSQIIFIAKQRQDLKMSYANVSGHGQFGWSKMISVPYEFQISSSQPRVETEAGTFFELGSGQVLKMLLKLNLDAHCMVSLEKRSTPFLRFEIASPLTYVVLDQNVPLGQIETAQEIASRGIKQQILSSQIVEFGLSQNEIKDGGTFLEAERRLGIGLQIPLTNSSDCFHGQMFQGSPQWKRPLTE
jgi:hypothetical protein